MYIEALEGRTLLSVKFVAPLLGSNEVPARDTPARGQAVFVLSKDASSLRYRVKAGRIQNTVMAHIHAGAPGENGGVVVDLMGSGTSKIGRRKAAMRGTITAAQLTGTLAGATLTDLVNAMTAGGTYVNVHTNDGVDPPDTGPGDFPGGEIRGQIRRLGRLPQNPGGGGDGGGGGGFPY